MFFLPKRCGLPLAITGLVMSVLLLGTSTAYAQSTDASDVVVVDSGNIFQQALDQERPSLPSERLTGEELRDRLLRSIRATKGHQPESLLSAEVKANSERDGSYQEPPEEILERESVAVSTRREDARVSESSSVDRQQPEKLPTPLRPLVIPNQRVGSLPKKISRTVATQDAAIQIAPVQKIAAINDEGETRLTSLQEMADCTIPGSCSSPDCVASGAPCACGATCGSACGCGSSCGTMQCTSACSRCGQCDSLCSCDCCRPRFWANVDVLLWQMSGYATPALLTQSPASTPRASAGALGLPATQVIAGNTNFGDGLRVGGRLQTGWWFDACRRVGIQGDFFALDGGGQSTVYQSSPGQYLARPFNNIDPNAMGADAQLVGDPGASEGSVRFNTSSNVVSAGPSLRFNLCCCEDVCNQRSSRTDFLIGYRFFRLEEEFSSQEILNITDPLYVDGTNYELNDRIRTQNDFHGIEFGLSQRVQSGRLGWDVTPLVAIGEVQRVVELDGFTWIEVPGVGERRSDGGFFVAPDQIGRFEDNDYAIIPQVRANLSYCLGSNWRIRAGYSFMYLNSAFRPGSFINHDIDGGGLAQQVDSVGRIDRPNFVKEDLFLHGANVGLSYNF